MGADGEDDGKGAAPPPNSGGEQPHLNFGKRLAHTDKVVRDKGFRVLKKWLQGHPDLDLFEYLKLWRGLYFAMWMSDKRPVQQELAVSIALLINDVPRTNWRLWMDAFWATMMDGWENLDRHRMSKSALFVRIVVAEAIKLLRLGGWDLGEARAVCGIFTQDMPKKGPNAISLGLFLHVVRIFWEEVRPQMQLEPPAPSEALMELIEPFCLLAETSTLRNITGYIHEYILRAAPREILELVVQRVLAGAAKPELHKKNREALYDTADAIEKPAVAPPGDAAKRRGADGWDLSRRKKRRQPRPRRRDQQEAGGGGAAEAADAAATASGADSAEMSPLMLPKAAVPAPKKAQKKKGKLGGRRAGGGEGAEVGGSTSTGKGAAKATKKAKRRSAAGASGAPPRKKRMAAPAGGAGEAGSDAPPLAT